MRVAVVSKSQPFDQLMAYMFEHGIDVDVVAEVEEIDAAADAIAKTNPERYCEPTQSMSINPEFSTAIHFPI